MMPCFTIRTTSVALDIANVELLGDAFRALGMSNVTTSLDHVSGWYKGTVVDWRAGKLTMEDNAGLTINGVKRAYAASAVKRAAKLNRWSLKAKGANYVATKRSY